MSPWWVETRRRCKIVATAALVAVALQVMAVKLDRRKGRWLVAHVVDWAVGTLFVAALAWCVKRCLHST